MKKAIVLFLALVLTAALCACTAGSSGSSPASVTIPETVLADAQGIKAVAKSIGPYQGEYIRLDRALLIEVTNSTEKAVSVGLTRASVNGCMVEVPMNYIVNPGETTTYPATFDDDRLAKFGITTIADLQFVFKVEDEETYETLLETQPIQIQTSAAASVSPVQEPAGQVVYDADGIRVLALTPYDSEYLGPTVDLYVVNGTDKTIDLRASSCTLNGKPVECYYGSFATPGKRSLDGLSFDEADRPEKIESLTLSLAIMDYQTGDPIVEATAPVTLTF